MRNDESWGEICMFAREMRDDAVFAHHLIRTCTIVVDKATISLHRFGLQTSHLWIIIHVWQVLIFISVVGVGM